MASAEQFANNASTTLNGAIVAGTNPITVTSATGFPGSNQYRIVIDTEIMIVTAGAGTTSWTVTRGAEGTTAASHANGAPVVHVLTSGAIGQALARLDLNNSYSNVITSIGFQLSPTVAVSSALAVGFALSPTLTAAVNSDILVGASIGATGANPVFATGTFTGLTATGLQIDAANFSKTGTGTIATAYGLRVTAPTIGTANITARIDGQVGFGSDPNVNLVMAITTGVTAAINGTAQTVAIDGALTASANGNGLRSVYIGGSAATGTFTGLNHYQLWLFPASKTGTGTIANAYGIYVNSPNIGTTNIGARIDGRVGFNTDPHVWASTSFAPTFTAIAASAALIDWGGTITAHANSDALYGVGFGTFTALTYAKGTFTGLTTFGLYVGGSGFAATGGGTIATAYGMYVTTPTIGTTNVCARFDGIVDLNNGVALGGGAAPTLGTIGGSGPATAAQNSWLKIMINGTASYIPIWR